MHVSRPTDASCAASSADTPKRLRRHGSAPYANKHPDGVNVAAACGLHQRRRPRRRRLVDVGARFEQQHDGVDEAVERRGPQRRVRGERRVVVQDGESPQVGDHVRSGHVDVRPPAVRPRTARRLRPGQRSCRVSARTTSRRRAPRPASSERLGRRGENGGSRYPRRRAPGSPRPRSYRVCPRYAVSTFSTAAGLRVGWRRAWKILATTRPTSCSTVTRSPSRQASYSRLPLTPIRSFCAASAALSRAWSGGRAAPNDSGRYSAASLRVRLVLADAKDELVPESSAGMPIAPECARVCAVNELTSSSAARAPRPSLRPRDTLERAARHLAFGRPRARRPIVPARRVAVGTSRRGARAAADVEIGRCSSTGPTSVVGPARATKRDALLYSASRRPRSEICPDRRVRPSGENVALEAVAKIGAAHLRPRRVRAAEVGAAAIPPAPTVSAGSPASTARW